MDENKVAILGGGAGAHGMAADLTLRDFNVSLCDLPQFADGLKRTIEIGEVDLTLAINGVARINQITTDIEEAIKDAKTIFVVAQSKADALFAEACAPYVQDGQIIVVIAGNCGSLVFVNTFKDQGVTKDVVICDTVSLPYGCRLKDPTRPGGPTHVRMMFLSPKFGIGVFPAKRTDEIVSYLKKYYPGRHPETVAMANVLEAGMRNPNPLVHCAPTLLNIGRIERVEDFALFHEGFSDSVIKVVIAVGKEREKIFDAMDWKVDVRTADTVDGYKKTWFRGCIPQEGLEEAWRFKGPMQPISVDRYITEDIPLGLVAWSSIGKLAGVDTPTIDATIHLASVINDMDYWAEGRTAESLRIAHMSVAELNDYLYNGA